MRPIHSDPWMGLARPHCRLEGDLKVLNIGGCPFVQDHEINGQLLHPPVFMRSQQLADNGNVLDVVDPHQNDGNVAGNALSPEGGWAAAASANGIGRRTRRPIGVEHVTREALEEARLVSIDAEMSQLHLSLGSGQCGGTLECIGVVVLVDQVQDIGARRSDDRPEGNARRLARSNPYTAPKRKTGSRTVPTVLERGRPSIAAIGARASRPRPRKRALSVSISVSPTISPSTTARWAAQISGSVGDRRRRVARMAPTMASYSVCMTCFV